MLLIDFLDQLGLRHLHLHFCLLPVDSVQRTVFGNPSESDGPYPSTIASSSPSAQTEYVRRVQVQGIQLRGICCRIHRRISVCSSRYQSTIVPCVLNWHELLTENTYLAESCFRIVMKKISSRRQKRELMR